MRSILAFGFSVQFTCAVLAGSGGSFTENTGQWPGQVLFRAAFQSHAVFVEHNAWTVVARSRAGDPHGIDHTPDVPPMRHHAYRVQFVDAVGPDPRGSELISGVENFLLGNDPVKWGSHARRFEELGSRDLYPGIDLRMRADGSFKYELLVRPGASTDLIELQYAGHDGLSLENGQLLIHTSVGMIIEQAPIAYQVINGHRIDVPCAYALSGDRLSYVLPRGYDRSRTLVIDPSLAFSTYSGSTSDNFAFGAAYDASGHLYASGITFGLGYPTTLGAYQTEWAGTTADIVLTKFALDGSTLLWSTFFGGTGAECPLAIAVNGADELFLLAVTGSSDHPTTVDAYDQTFHGGPSYAPTGLGIAFPDGHDLGLARFSADGGSLIASTYLGGSGGDGANTTTPLAHNYGDNFRSGLILNANGDPVVATTTSSTDLPTANAPQGASAGLQEGYVFRMSAALDALPWASYLGGTGNDAAYALCNNSLGELLVVGGTTSADLPMNGSPFDATFGGVADGFVARFSAEGAALLSSTYLGTAAYDQAYSVDTDASNSVLVSGQTEGGYPVTPGLYSSPGGRMFLQMLSADLSVGDWSTEFGNGTNIAPVAFGVDLSGRILFSGFADNIMAGGGTTIGLPTTVDAFQSTTDGHDLYIMVLEPGAVALEYATYLGGTESHEHTEGATGAIDGHGDLYLAVCTGCGAHSDFPTTPGAWSATNNSPNCNLAAVKFITDGTTGIVGRGTVAQPFIWPTLTEAILHISGCDSPPCEVLISDATGRIVLRSALNVGSDVVIMDGFAPGVYQLRMGAGHDAKSARFIVP